MLYGAPPDGDGSDRMNRLRQRLTEMEETTRSSGWQGPERCCRLDGDGWGAAGSEWSW